MKLKVINKMKLTTASILELLSHDQQYDLYKILRAKFESVSENEEVYYVFNSGYTARLLQDRKAENTTLKETVLEVFDDREFEERPIFIYDDCWGNGLYLRDGVNYINLGSDMDKIKDIVDPDLFYIISKKYHCVCFKRTDHTALYHMMRDIDYCCMFNIEGIKYDCTPSGTRVIIETVDAESG